MTEFQTPIDIANRGLQHCGAQRIDPLLGFAENSKNASEISFVYGKLRRAELRRNIWRFATRRAVIRATDTNTMLLAPAMWSQTTTYFLGSIVEDQSGNLWISRIPNNLGFDPLNSTAWEPYFGPLSVMRYDSSQGYLSGEIVYTAAGDGTYNTYLSLMNSNAVHPALPSQWSVGTTYFKNQVVQSFPGWLSVTTYTQGQTVTFLGIVYTSLTNGNLNNSPPTSPASWVVTPVLTIATQAVPVTSLAVQPQSSPVIEWSQGTTYSLGSFVMFNAKQYLSIANNNTGQFPNATGSTFWAQVTGGTSYMSLIDLNAGNTPSNAPALWSSIVTYAIGNTVGGSNGVIYKSLINGNVNLDPTVDSGGNWQNTGVLNPWTTVFAQGGGNPMWMQIGGASFPAGVGITTPNITYPLGAGPASQSATHNVYRLPSGYLRTAPQDPKAGSVSLLGAPSGLMYTDWLFEGDYIVSREVGPIVLRFVADVTDVTKMDDMFCEGLAARIAIEVCEVLTQSSAKLQMIGKAYDKFMSEARTVNAIETGAEEPPEDDWVTCRS